MVLTMNKYDQREKFNKNLKTAEGLIKCKNKDFTKEKNRNKSFILTIKFYIFCYSVHFSLIVFIIIGLTKGGHLFSGNILSVLY